MRLKKEKADKRLLRPFPNPQMVQDLQWKSILRGDPCTYCGQIPKKSRGSVEHVVPKSEGGRETRENLVGACTFCNQARGNQPLLFFLLNPKKWVLGVWKQRGGSFVGTQGQVLGGGEQ